MNTSIEGFGPEASPKVGRTDESPMDIDDHGEGPSGSTHPGNAPKSADLFRSTTIEGFIQLAKHSLTAASDLRNLYRIGGSQDFRPWILDTAQAYLFSVQDILQDPGQEGIEWMQLPVQDSDKNSWRRFSSSS